MLIEYVGIQGNSKYRNLGTLPYMTNCCFDYGYNSPLFWNSGNHKIGRIRMVQCGAWNTGPSAYSLANFNNFKALEIVDGGWSVQSSVWGMEFDNCDDIILSGVDVARQTAVAGFAFNACNRVNINGCSIHNEPTNPPGSLGTAIIFEGAVSTAVNITGCNLVGDLAFGSIW